MINEIKTLYMVGEEDARKLDAMEIKSRLLTGLFGKAEENERINLVVKAYAEMVLKKDNGDYYGSKLYILSEYGNWYRIHSYGFIKAFREIVKKTGEEKRVSINVSLEHLEGGKVRYKVEGVG